MKRVSLVFLLSTASLFARELKLGQNVKVNVDNYVVTCTSDVGQIVGIITNSHTYYEVHMNACRTETKNSVTLFALEEDVRPITKK